jgi:hypothetical protein
VAGVGDVNADGYDDVLVGAPGDDTGGSTSGAAYLVLGPMAGLLDLSAATAKLAGEGYYAYAGYSVASAGDVNDDGYPDLLIGAPLAANSGNYAGAAYLVSSPVAGQISLSAATARLSGRGFYDFAGRTVSGAGDMNNDGYDDFMIGAPYNDASATDAGAAYFFYGPVSGTLDMGNASLVLQGENSYDYAGMSVSSGGDTNGDGYTELLIGAPRNDAGASSAGAAYLLKGGPRF